MFLEPHLIWVLGGDAWQKRRNVDTPSRLTLVRAMAEGLADGATGVDRFDGQADWHNTLMTFHPPGAFQMGHLRRLIESLPDPLQRVPDQSLLASEAGTGNEHIAVTRDAGRRHALVYSAAGRPFTVKLERLAGDRLRAAWFHQTLRGTGAARALATMKAPAWIRSMRHHTASALAVVDSLGAALVPRAEDLCCGSLHR